ncbi:MAG: 1,4-alpha-glucan branching protein [Chitinophagaceae bacterium]|nr:MAG: 1,4-alpha-glucan branching protein [Chitinophagaceae bacterium]
MHRSTKTYKNFNLSNFHQPSFLHASNIYCVNLRQYSAEGSFSAFEQSLPLLKEMGVEILWFMPIHPIGKQNRKGSLGSYYSIADFKAVNPEFGDRAAFKQLVERAHELGMKVIMDWVANHAAWDNVWTISHPEFFEKDEQGNFKSPYDWEDVIQFNHQNEAQQQAMIDAMLFWISEFDIDGFRADLAHLTPLSFWINARVQASGIKDNLIWLAETEEISYHQAFDISFTWKWMHATEAYFKGEKGFSELIEVLQHYKNDFPSDAVRMWFTSNHDENSWNGTAFEKYGAFVKALSVFNCTYFGIPLIYSGEEVGLNKRLKFFDKDPIRWNSGEEWRSFYKTLLQLRKNHPAFCGDLETFPEFLQCSNGREVIAFARKKTDAIVAVIINLGKNAQTFQAEEAGLIGKWSNLFSGENIEFHSDHLFQVEPAGFLVFDKK